MKKFLTATLCVLLMFSSFFALSACTPQTPVGTDDSDWTSESDWLEKYY